MLSLYTHCRIYGFFPFLQYLMTPFFNDGLLTYRVTDSGGEVGRRWGGGRGLKLRLHPLCACVVAAAMESLDYTLADEVLNHGLAAFKIVRSSSSVFGFPCLFQSPLGNSCYYYIACRQCGRAVGGFGF